MPPSTAEVVVQVSLFVVAAIAIVGGALQMYLGQPQSAPRLDNVHRFMAGVYLSTGIIIAWVAATIQHQDTLIDLIALGVFLGGSGRLLSIAKVGLPAPARLWIGYLVPELLLPVVIVIAHHSVG